MSLFYTGSRGALKLNGEKLAKVRDWTIDGKMTTVDIAALDEAEPRYRTLKRSFDGTCSLIYYKDADEFIDASLIVGAVFSVGAVDPDKSLQLELRADDMSLVFDAVITSAKLGVSVGAVMMAEIGFSVSGSLKAVELGGRERRSVR